MPIDAKTAIRDIDDICNRRDEIGCDGEQSGLHTSEMIARECAAINRVAPSNGSHVQLMNRILADRTISEEYVEEQLIGILHALRSDYCAGRMQTFQELIRADMFSDFLEMAEYFLDGGYKDAAAVTAGGVIEQHLRKLCGKCRVALSGRPKLDAMNADLAKQGAYGKNDQKQVTAWADIRNDAAHGDYAKYAAQQVKFMIAGIRDFISRNLA
jgi:hypothetical protein